MRGVVASVGAVHRDEQPCWFPGALRDGDKQSIETRGRVSRRSAATATTAGRSGGEGHRHDVGGLQVAGTRVGVLVGSLHLHPVLPRRELLRIQRRAGEGERSGGRCHLIEGPAPLTGGIVAAVHEAVRTCHSRVPRIIAEVDPAAVGHTVGGAVGDHQAPLGVDRGRV